MFFCSSCECDCSGYGDVENINLRFNFLTVGFQLAPFLCHGCFGASPSFKLGIEEKYNRTQCFLERKFSSRSFIILFKPFHEYLTVKKWRKNYLITLQFQAFTRTVKKRLLHLFGALLEILIIIMIMSEISNLNNNNNNG